MIDDTKFTEEERKEAMDDAIESVAFSRAISDLYTSNSKSNEKINRQLDELDRYVINDMYEINLQIIELERGNT